MFWDIFWRKFNQGLSSLALFLIAFYKSFLSGTLASGATCRFYPSCSEYALKVYREYSFFKASLFVVKRLLACQPFGPKVREEPELEVTSKKEKH